MNECTVDVKNKKEKRNIIVMQVLLLFVFLSLWELLAYLKVVNTFLVSKPSDIIKLFIQYIINNEIWSHTLISVYETLIGLIVGTLLGIIIAFILWYFPIVHKITKPYMNLLNCLPKTALAPIIIIWAGTGVSGIVVVAISILIIITILSAYNHFINVDEEKIKMFESFKAKRIVIFFKLILPSNLSNIFSIIKINLGLSWVGVIVGEFLVSKKGLGYLIMYGGQVFKLDLVMMGVLVLSICAFLMYVLIEKIEKYLFRKEG